MAYELIEQNNRAKDRDYFYRKAELGGNEGMTPGTLQGILEISQTQTFARLRGTLSYRNELKEN